jgi:transposase-like protein
MSNALVAPHFQSHEAAREWLEKTRWPEGPVCSHCGSLGRAYALKKPGWYRCAEPECRKDFTVTTGTVMERSHIPLNKWLLAFYQMSASKKGMSAHQLHRSLGVTYKAAWFMCHRIREAMSDDDPAKGGPLGGSGKIVEADETYFGNVPESKRRGRTTRGRPFTRKAGLPISARSFRLWNAAAGFARFIQLLPTPAPLSASLPKTSPRKAACTPTKAGSTLSLARSLQSMKP